MNPHAKQYAKQVLRLYPQFPALIAQRKLELLSPVETDPDQNIGGGSDGHVGQPTEAKAVRLLTDQKINTLEAHKKAVESVLSQSDAITREIIQTHYMDDKALKIVAEELNLTVSFIKATENQFLHRLIKKLNLLF